MALDIQPWLTMATMFMKWIWECCIMFIPLSLDIAFLICNFIKIMFDNLYIFKAWIVFLSKEWISKMMKLLCIKWHPILVIHTLYGGF